MRLAVEHAESVKGATYPNPPVGAVILDRDGEVAGVGRTEPAGGPHAEVVALRRAGELALSKPRDKGRRGRSSDAAGRNASEA